MYENMQLHEMTGRIQAICPNPSQVYTVARAGVAWILGRIDHMERSKVFIQICVPLLKPSRMV